MATLIEDQIHKVFIAREKERCRALAAKTGKPVEPDEVPKPWRRDGRGILQDLELLKCVSEFDYDLADPKFQDYCRERGVLHVAGELDSQRWAYAKDWRKGKRVFLANPHFQRAQPHEGKTYRYTAEELETHWGILCLARATLQDCWELYRPAKDPAPKPARKRGARPEPPAPAKTKRKRPLQRSIFEEVPANARVRRRRR